MKDKKRCLLTILLITGIIMGNISSVVYADENLFLGTSESVLETDSFRESEETETEEVNHKDDLTETEQDQTQDETENTETEESIEETENIQESDNNQNTIETESMAAQDSETENTYQVKEFKEISLKYDDRYAFNEHEEFDGYKIERIEDIAVESYKVQKSKKTALKDEHVITLGKDEKYDIIASGIGNAKVILVPEKTDESAEVNTADAIEVDISVEPATLTLMFLTGQSNMEGYSADNTGYHPEDSIVCEAGQVYSTYVPTNRRTSSKIGNVSFDGVCTVDNAGSYVAGSLTGQQSAEGTQLKYPLNVLTDEGTGKSGMDGALAYEWHVLSNEKVWVVNTAYSGTRIDKWMPGQECYERAEAVFQYVLRTMNAEIEAGHYVGGKRLMFWQQGETDGLAGTDYQTYYSDFLQMYESFKSVLDTDYCGIIVSRAHHGSETNEEDIAMTGARQAQYLLAIDTDHADIYMVSNVNEEWVNDKGVQDYFQNNYPSGQVTYPLRKNTTLYNLPESVSDVHAGVHYAQVAHNENGLTAAECMYKIAEGVSGNPSASWKNMDGETVTNIECTIGEQLPVVPVVSPLYLSKKIKFAADDKYLTALDNTGNYLAVDAGETQLKIKNRIGVSVGILQVNIKSLPALQLTVIANDNKKVTLKWNIVDRADRYIVYRKSGNSGWKRIGESKTGEFADSNVKNLEKYSYTVRAEYNGHLGEYDHTGISIVYLDMPMIQSVANTSKGIQLKWTAISGAEKYAVFRKQDGGKWTRIGLGGSLSFTDTNAENGQKYTYTIVARKGSSASGYDKKGQSVYRLGEPTVSIKGVGKNFIDVGWNRIQGADGYYIYRKSGNSGWKRIANVTGDKNTSYSDKNVSKDIHYFYTVRAYKEQVISTYGNGQEAWCVKQPEAVSKVSAVKGECKVNLNWTAVSDASGYGIYMRVSGNDAWKTVVSETTKTKYTISDLDPGVKYEFMVRSYIKQGKMKAYGKYSKIVNAVPYEIVPGKPTALKATAGDQKVVLSWQSGENATGYNVFFYDAKTKEMTAVCSTKNNSCTINNLKNNTKYSLVVRSYRKCESHVTRSDYTSPVTVIPNVQKK